jgi:hypothetical protein
MMVVTFSLNMVPRNFFLFPKANIQLKRWRFKDLREIEVQSQVVLDCITRREFHRCLQQWERCWAHCETSDRQ